jgi:site-specific DNA recombinase
MVVARQEADCRKLAEQMGWEVAGVFVDNDVSAYRKKARPGYTALLTALDAGEADAVLAWHTDRLHRSPKELERYIEVCEPRAIATHTVRTGGLDLATPSGRMVARQLGAVARYESEQTAGRTKAGKDDAASRGEFQGGQRLYGWEFVPKTDRGPGGSALRVIQAEAEVVREASARLLAGESLRCIARSLNDAGKGTAKGTPWTGSALRKVLLRPSTAGLRAKGGEVLGKGQWEALLPEDEWRGVVALLTDPARRTNTDKYARAYLGSGLYVCGVCGGTLGGNSTAGGGPGGRRTAYRCRVGDREGKSHVVRATEPLDAFVVELITTRLGEPDALTIPRGPTVDTAPMHTEASALRARMDQLATQWVELDMTQSQFLTANRELRRRLEDVEERIAKSRTSTVLDGLGDIRGTWSSLSLDRQRAIVDTLVTVTVLPRHRNGRLAADEDPTPPAWWPEGASWSYWDPTKVTVTWKGAA